jgi:hypothetical protein
MTGRPPRLPKVDHMAMSALRRETPLTANETFMLLGLALYSSWRSGLWTGSALILQDDLGFSRNTVPRLLRSLAAKGMIEVIEPFGGGRQGVLRVVPLRDLIPEKRSAESAPFCAEATDEVRALPAQSPRSPRAVRAQSPRRMARTSWENEAIPRY